MKVFFDTWFYVRASKLPYPQQVEMATSLKGMGIVPVVSPTLQRELAPLPKHGVDADWLQLVAEKVLLCGALKDVSSLAVDGALPGWRFLLDPLMLDVTGEVSAGLGIPRPVSRETSAMLLEARLALEEAEQMAHAARVQGAATHGPAAFPDDVLNFDQSELGAIGIPMAFFESLAGQLEDPAVRTIVDGLFGGPGRALEFRHYLRGESAQLPAWLIDNAVQNCRIDRGALGAKKLGTDDARLRRLRGDLHDALHIRTFIRHADVIDFFFCDTKQRARISRVVGHDLEALGLTERVLSAVEPIEAIVLLEGRAAERV